MFLARTRTRTLSNHRPFCMSVHANQQLEKKPLQLPRLPVPDLSKTLTKYLASLEPHLQEESLRTGIPYEQAYALREKWAESFGKGIGKTCQERLKDGKSPNNWLDDNFWLKNYLEWRVPLLINSNWWLVLYDDESHSRTIVPSGFTDWQLKRAAWLTHRTLELKEKIDSQEIHPDTTRTGVWFRESVSKIFNACRIPHGTCDILSPLFPLTDPLSQNIVVIAKNWFYALRAYEPNPTSGILEPVSASQILDRMVSIAHDADKREGKAPMIGVLSADDRDSWAQNLSHLLSISPQNRHVHDTIVRSSFCVSLDSETRVLPEDYPTFLSNDQTSRQRSLDAHVHSVRSTSSNVSNRFFDKPYTLIIDPSGQAGAMGEHSPCDALVPSMVGEYAIVQSVPEELAATGSQVSVDKSQGWHRLDWITDSHIDSACVEAKDRADRLIANSDDSVLWFEGFGSDCIKNLGLSPDAFVQLALQLAWFRTHPKENRFTATYETALTRMFHRGRTETIRTLSADSRRWVLAMEDSNVTSKSKHALLLRALQTHTSLTREAMTGRGIDRHLLGLRNMLTPEELASPSRYPGVELFSDPLYGKSQEWLLSTSGLSEGLLFKGTGFGAAYENGYGINYLTAPHSIKFGIESKHSSVQTSTVRLQEAIVRALWDMHAICVDAEGNKESDDVRSKL